MASEAAIEKKGRRRSCRREKRSDHCVACLFSGFPAELPQSGSQLHPEVRVPVKVALYTTPAFQVIVIASCLLPGGLWSVRGPLYLPLTCDYPLTFLTPFLHLCKKYQKASVLNPPWIILVWVSHFGARLTHGLDALSGVSNPWPMDHRWPRMAMNVAQHKIINWLKTFFLLISFPWCLCI